MSDFQIAIAIRSLQFIFAFSWFANHFDGSHRGESAEQGAGSGERRAETLVK